MDLKESDENPDIPQVLVSASEEDVEDLSLFDPLQETSMPEQNKDDLQAISDQLLEMKEKNLVGKRNMYLRKLGTYITNNNPNNIPENMKDLQDHMVDLLGTCNGTTLALNLKALTAMLKHTRLRENLIAKSEVFIKAVINTFAVRDTWVFFCAKECGLAMAEVWPSDVLVPQLTGLLLEEYPICRGVVEILGHFVEIKSKDFVLNYLGIFLPEVINAYEVKCIRFRRSVLFLFSSLYGLFGAEDLEPYVVELAPWKRALLFGFGECHSKLKSKSDVKPDPDSMPESSDSHVSKKVKSDDEEEIEIEVKVKTEPETDPIELGPLSEGNAPSNSKDEPKTPPDSEDVKQPPAEETSITSEADLEANKSEPFFLDELVF